MATPAQVRTGPDHGDRFERVAYFIQWGVYGRDYHVKDLDTTGAAGKLTRINHAFGSVGPQGDSASSPTRCSPPRGAPGRRPPAWISGSRATCPAPRPAAGSDDYRNLVNKPGKRYRDLRTGTTWIYDGNEFWSYDDPASVLRKAAYIRLRGLGGSMMWSIDQDDAKASLTSALYSVPR